jgi:hypothetical protein
LIFLLFFAVFLPAHLLFYFFLLQLAAVMNLLLKMKGNFDIAGAAKSATAAIQPPFASLERLGVQISAVPLEILDFFHEFNRVTVSQYHPQHFWIFDGAEVDFYVYSAPRDGVQFLEAMWKKYRNFITYFKLRIFGGGAMLILLCCVLAQMRNTNFDNVTKAKRWKSIVQELMKEGFKLDFIFEHFPRPLETYLAKGIAAGITTKAAYGVVIEATDDVVAKVVDAVILEIIENASNLREIPAVGETPVI